MVGLIGETAPSLVEDHVGDVIEGTSKHMWCSLSISLSLGYFGFYDE
jgi:hypothetical protein